MKSFAAFVVVMVALVFFLAFNAKAELDRYTGECQAKGGTMIKSIDGWMCAKVVQPLEQ